MTVITQENTVTTTTKPHPGSLNASLYAMEPDTYLYLECSADNMMQLQSRVSSKSRWPTSMAGYKFTVAGYTAIGRGRADDIVFLVRIHRTA